MTIQRDEWAWAALGREAILNVFLPGTRHLILLLIAIFAGSAQIVVDAIRWDAFDAALERQEMNGRNFVIIAAQRPTKDFGITVASCQALMLQEQIDVAGSIADYGREDIVPLGSRVPVFGLSPGLLSRLGSGSAVVGSELGLGSQRQFVLGARTGVLQVTAGQPHFPALRLNGGVAVIADPLVRQAPVCVVKVKNHVSVTPRLLAQLTAGIDVSGAPAAARSAVDSPVDLISDFQSRPERMLPILIGVLGGLISAVQLRLSGSPIAAYRLSGTSALGYTRISILEQAALSGVMATSATASAVVLAGSLGSPVSSITRSVLGAFCWIITHYVLSLATLRRSAVLLAKDR